MSDHRRETLKTGAVLLLLTAMTLALFGPALFSGGVFRLHDSSFLFYPGYAYFRECMSQGALPLWNPYTGCGEPFLADIERQVLYPPNLIYLFVPTRTAVVLVPALHILLAGAATYGLSRLWRLSRAASALAAVLYAYSSYTVWKVAFASELASAAWFPVVLCALVFWIRHRSRRRLFLLAGAICLQFLAGFPETLTFSIFALGLYAAFVGWSEWRRRRQWRALLVPLLGLGAAGIAAILLCAPQLLPTWEALEASVRSGEFDPRVDEFSLHPLAIFSLLVPSVYGTGASAIPATYWAPSISDIAVGAFYIGVVPIVGIVAAGFGRLLGACARGKEGLDLADSCVRVRAPFLVTLFLLFFLYSLGKYTPFYAFCRENVPLLQHFVSPPKSLLCVVLALGCLAGIAMDDLARAFDHRLEGRPRWRSLAGRWGGLCVFGAVSVLMVACLTNHGQLGKAILIRFFNLGSVDPSLSALIPWDDLVRDSVKLAVLGVVSAALFHVYAFRARAKGAASWLIVLLAFGDLLWANGEILRPDPAEILEHRPAHLEKLRPEGQLRRFFGLGHFFQPATHAMLSRLPRPKEEVVLSGTAVDAFGEQGWRKLDRILRDCSYKSWPLVDKTFNAYSDNNFVARDVARMLRVITLTDAPADAKQRMLAMLNCDKVLLPPDPTGIFTGGGRGGTRLGKLEEPLPRACVVGGMIVLKDLDSVFAVMRKVPFDPWAAALIGEDGAGGEAFADLRPARVRHTVEWLTYQPNVIELAVNSETPGMLVVSDTHFPGWVALLGDEPVPIYKVNGAFRGVRIPAGQSRVKMIYEPTSLKIGVGVSLLTLLVLLTASLPWRRRPRPPNPHAASVVDRGQRTP